jgi:hypothetical protein
MASLHFVHQARLLLEEFHGHLHLRLGREAVVARIQQALDLEARKVLELRGKARARWSVAGISPSFVFSTAIR